MKLNDQFPAFAAHSKPVPNGLIPEGVGLPPYGGDLNTQHKTVSDNDWLEELASLPGRVLPRVASFVSTNSDYVDTGIDLSNAVNIDLTMICYRASTNINTTSSQYESVNKNIGIQWATDNNIYVLASAGVPAYGNILNLNIGWVILRCVYNGSGLTNPDKLKLYVNGILQTLSFTGVIPSQLAATANKFDIGRALSAYTDGLISYISISKDGATASQYYPTGQGSHEYDISTNGNHGTINGTGTHFDYDINGSLYPLKNGLSMYSNIAGDLIRVPYDINKLPLVAPPVPAGYTIRSEHPASVGNFNMFDCLVDFEYGSILQNDTAGIAYATQNDAYGLVFDGIINKGGETRSPKIVFLSSLTLPQTQTEGYYINIGGNEDISLLRSNISSANVLFATSISYILNNTDYRFLIWRNETINQFVTGGIGTFVFYIQGKSKPITTTEYLVPNLVEMELIDPTGGSGQNPITDNTYKTSEFIVPDLDAGDQISKINVNGKYISPYDFTVSTGTYSIIDNPANANFNRFNATIFNDDARAAGSDYNPDYPFQFLIDNLDPRILFTWRNVGHKGMLYAKIYLDANLNIIWMFEMLNYLSDHVDEEEHQIMIYCGYEPIIMVDENGDYLIDGDDYVLIEGL